MEDTVKTIQVQENGQEMGVIMAMTQEEADDKSYVDYLTEAQTEKTKDYLRNKPKKEPTVDSKEAGGALKEHNEYRQWHRENPGSRKYYGGFTLPS